MSDSTRRVVLDQSPPMPTEATFLGGILRKGESIEGWVVESKIQVASGEAELYIANKDGQTAVVKYYRQNVTPKEEILAKLAAFKHEDIIQLLAYGTYNGLFYEVMEFAAGGGLDSRDAAGKSKYLPLDEGQVIQMVREVNNAYKACHAIGIIHRDIKPANILFSAEGRPFLADFGIAKSRENLFETQTGQMLGTPAFISPEQALGEIVDARADQYSFAITLYKTLAGVLPFTAEGQIQTLMQRVRQDPDPLWTYRPDLAPGFAKVIMRALLRHRDERWGSMADMRQAMQEACAESSIVWNQPLDGIADFPLAREPLPADLQLQPRGAATRRRYPDPDPTADLVVHRSSPRRWPWLGVAAALAGVAWLVSTRMFRPVEPAVHPEENQRQVQVMPPAPVATKEPVREIPREKPSVAPPVAVPVPRRPVFYPELLDAGPQPTGFPAACQGVKVNLSLLIGVDGRVKSCNVKSKVTEECAEAAKALALRYQYKPALDAEKQPVECLIAVAIDF